MQPLFRLLAGVAAAVLSLSTHAAVSFTFDAGAQGWTAIDGGDLAWQSGGGNGGGYLQVTDVSNDDFLFLAPAGLGNLASYLGGTLSFDARNINSDTPDWAPFGTMVISNGGSTVTVDLIAPNQPPADGLWHHYKVPLTVAVWGASLPSVLANVTGLTIKGEFHAGVTEVVGFDNISISAVPEPGEMAMLLAGLGVVGVAVRRRQMPSSAQETGRI